MTPERKTAAPLVETSWLAEQLGNPDLRILDCSVTMEVTEEGDHTYRSGKADWDDAHIPGSVFIDLLCDLGPRHHPTVPVMTPLVDFAAAMESCGIGDDHQVVLYDRSNHAWAACVWWMMRATGHESVVLHGGWQKWTAEQRPVSAEPTAYASGGFTVRERPSLMATKQRVLESISSGKSAIINGLSADEHSGRVIRFPRAGRIASSVNVDCELLVDPDTHTLLPADQLRMIFDSVGALTRESAITYCGGGVAASLNALALTLLGVPDVAVYDGGLIEWAADPKLPMEIG